MEIVPGVFHLKIPIPNNPLGNLNAYLVRGDDGYIMVDAGWPKEDTLRLLIEEIERVGAAPRDIKTIYVSHAHPDHLGLAGRFRELYGTEIVMHRLEAPSTFPDRWDMDDTIWNWLSLNGMDREGVSTNRQTKFGNNDFTWRVEPDRMVEGGETIDLGTCALRVLFTPGHSRGHICLYDEQRKILFAGDHVLPVITPNISFYPRSVDDPLGSFIESLKKIMPLDVETVLPGHQNIFHNLKQRVLQIIGHHSERLLELLAVLGDERKTAFDISCGMQWTGVSEEILQGSDLAPKQQMGAMGETLAHLEYLRIRGVVSRSVDGELALFKRDSSVDPAPLV